VCNGPTGNDPLKLYYFLPLSSVIYTPTLKLTFTYVEYSIASPDREVREEEHTSPPFSLLFLPAILG
jgi:hypothetical protein